MLNATRISAGDSRCTMSVPRRAPTGVRLVARSAAKAALAFLLLIACTSARAQQADPAGGPPGVETGTTADGGEQEPGPEDVPSAAEQRELGGNEDPMAADEARREVERVEEEKPADVRPERPTGFDVYGSIRIRYRDQGNEEGLQDGGSRAGSDIEWRFREDSYVIARYEAGFNILTGVDRVADPGTTNGEEFKDTVFTRLAYAGLDTPAVNAVGGKNWSPYYKVSGMTDRFEGTGGSASGTYNAQTDGGPTGTGRADRMLQTHLSIDFLPQRWFKPFELNLQAQHGNEIPFGGGAEYGTAVDVSAVLTTHNGISVGLAYNHAEIDIDASLRNIGLTNDAQAALIGARALGDRWYAAVVAGRYSNHETTDDGIYFDGWGSEFYGDLQLTDRIWAVAGYNVLEPFSEEVQAREYRVRYAVLGLRYTFDDFRRMIFANVRLDDSRKADGTPGSNVFTVGVRWDLSKRGWGLSR